MIIDNKIKLKFSYYFRKYFIIFIKIFRISLVDTVRQDGIEHAGYLAFLGFLSLFPFLIFLFSITGYIGASDAGSHFIKMLLEMLPIEISGNIKPRIDEIISGPPQQFLTIAIIGVIWTASSSVEGSRTILNRAYRVCSPPPYILRRLFSVLEFFIVTFLLVIGILIFIIIPDAISAVINKLHIEFILDIKFSNLRYFALFLLILFSNTLLYFGLPNCKQEITQTIPGSILVGFLTIILIKLFLFYITNFQQFNLVYGSLAGIIAILMFFYFLALIFIFGAEFNYHFHRVYKIYLKKKAK